MQILDCPRCAQSCDAEHRHCPACGWNLRKAFDRRSIRLPRLRSKPAVPWWETRWQFIVGMVGIAGLIAYLAYAVVKTGPAMLQSLAIWMVGVGLAAVVLVLVIWFIGRVVELVTKHTANQERMIRRLDRIHDEMAKLNAAIDRSRKHKEP